MSKAIILISLLCLFTSSLSFAQSSSSTQSQALFKEYVSKTSNEEYEMQASEKRARKAFLSTRALTKSLEESIDIQLNLFEDVQFEIKLQKERTTTYKNLQIWKGRTADARFDHLPQYRNVILVFNPNTKKMVGLVEAAEGTFSFHPETMAKTYRIVEHKENHFHCEGSIKGEDHHAHLNLKSKSNLKSVGGCDDIDDNGNYILDIFIGFSNSAAAEVGDIDAHAAMLVETVNTGFTNSLVTDVILRLVGTGTTPNNPGVVSSVLSDSKEWFATEVMETGADFLATIQTYTGASGEEGGIAYQPGYTSVNNTGPYAFRHEFGHNIGGDHCPGDNGIESYAHGYEDGAWESHLCGNDYNFYSTPLVNNSLGNPIGDPNTADMVRLINERKLIMSHKTPHRVPFDANDPAPCNFGIPFHTGSEGYNIINVSIGTINNSSGSSWSNPIMGYSDYSFLSTQVNTNTSYTMTVTTDDYSNYENSIGNRLGVWIDWNQDYFLESNEQIIDLTAAQVNSNTWTFTITPPSNTTSGTVGMRIRYLYNEFEDPIHPFNTTYYNGGETEDYSLTLNGPCTELTYFADTDGDGYGDSNNTIEDCTQPAGYVSNDSDCDDNNASIYPSASCDDGNNNTVNDQYNANCQCVGTPANCIENELNLQLELDYYSEETTWEIVDANGVVVVSGGTYDGQPYELITESACLSDGCYDFIIYDTYGDGICCAQGDGSYLLEDAAGQVLASGGEFGTIESTNFCLNSGNCNNQLINFHDFESGWGIWNDGGSDCRKNSNDSPYANSGIKCVRLRDNTSTSVMTTDDLDLSTFEEITIDFSFWVESFENTEDFWLQISTNGGATFTTVEDWVRTVDFQNSERHNPSVTINGPFTNDCQIRFRCDASGNGDKVYIDDVNIEGCSTAGNNLILAGNEDDTFDNTETFDLNEFEYDGEKEISEMHLFPNPVSSELTIEYQTFEAANTSSVELINLTGQRVLFQAIEVSPGLNSIQLNVREIPRGTYLLKIMEPNRQLVKQVVIMR